MLADCFLKNGYNPWVPHVNVACTAQAIHILLTSRISFHHNRTALRRLVTALAMEQSEEWVSGRRYLDMSERLPGTAQEGAATDQGVAGIVATRVEPGGCILPARTVGSAP